MITKAYISIANLPYVLLIIPIVIFNKFSTYIQFLKKIMVVVTKTGVKNLIYKMEDTVIQKLMSIIFFM